MEERLLDIEIPFKRYNNLTKEEQLDVLYRLKDDPSIIIKGVSKGSAVVACDREYYLKEAYKQLVEREVYGEVLNDPNILINTVTKVLEKIHLRIDLSGDTLTIIFLSKIPNLLGSVFYPKFITAYMTYRVDQLFQTADFILKIYLHFWTTICKHLLRRLNLIF